MVRRALADLRAPDEIGARQRAWGTVRAAYAGRPVPAPARSRRRFAVVPVVAIALIAVALSPAGATVTRIIKRALSAPHIAPAAGVALPAPGKLLVSDARGTWVVSSGGGVRRLGPWTQASWSPRGLYAAVASATSLAAVSPNGAVAWRLPVRGASDPRWYQPSGYRVAYRAGGNLRELTGDGRGDHLVARGVAPIAPAWRPGHEFQLAYATPGGAVVVLDGDTGAGAWRSRPHPGRPLGLAWSPDGSRLSLVTSAGAWLLLPGQSPPLSVRLPVRGPLLGGAASPDGRRLALVRGGPTRQLEVADLTTPTRPARTMLSGLGVSAPTWSADGRWLLVSWSAQNQWLFVHVAGRPRILAASRVAGRFGISGPSGGPLRVDGWCCSP
jgi:hypothetical protein